MSGSDGVELTSPDLWSLEEGVGVCGGGGCGGGTRRGRSGGEDSVVLTAAMLSFFL